MSTSTLGVLALWLGLAGAACRAASDDPASDTWKVLVVLDEGRGAESVRVADVRVAPDATALDATRAAARVEQDYVCCSREDVWAIDGLESDAARDGYWTWWLDGELGPGFAHQVPVHDGATVEWRYQLADPEGRGAAASTRIAALSVEACLALESFGGGNNLVAHGETCGLARHAALPRLSASQPASVWEALRIEWAVDCDPVPAGATALVFAPGFELAAWEALGAASGRLGAARVAWTSRSRSR